MSLTAFKAPGGIITTYCSLTNLADHTGITSVNSSVTLGGQDGEEVEEEKIGGWNSFSPPQLSLVSTSYFFI